MPSIQAKEKNIFQRITYNQSSPFSLLLVCEADSEGNHDTVGIAEVLPHTLHGCRALGYRQRADRVHVGRLRGDRVLGGAGGDDGGGGLLGDCRGGAADSILTRKVLQSKVQDGKCNECNYECSR